MLYAIISTIAFCVLAFIALALKAGWKRALQIIALVLGSAIVVFGSLFFL